MTQINFNRTNAEGYLLTTDHSASSYGMPVLVHKGEAFGPADVVSATDGWIKGLTARDIVKQESAPQFFDALNVVRDEEQQAMIDRFVEA